MNAPHPALQEPSATALPAALAWLRSSLSRQIIAALLTSLLCAVLALLALTQWMGHQTLQAEHEAGAQRVLGLFEASLQNAMLKRDLQGLDQILEALNQSRGVRRALLLNPKGEIRFPAQIPKQGDSTRMQEVVRGLCLSAGCPVPKPESQWRDGPAGSFLSIAWPVRNRTECQQCHGSMDSRPVNGVLWVEFDVTQSAAQWIRQSHILLAASLAALALLALSMVWALRTTVIRPLQSLRQATDRIAEGDLKARADIPGHDELSRVGNHFNRMTERMESMVMRLTRQQQFLQDLVDACPDPLLVIGPGHRIALANNAYCKLLGRDSAGVVGQCCHQVSRGLPEPCPPTLVNCPIEVLRAGGSDEDLRGQGHTMRTVMAMRHRDGHEIEVEIDAATLRDSEGQTLVVQVFRPLDRTVEFSQEQRLSAIGLLANGVAHEINNPLASIRLALQACLRGLRNGSISSQEITDYLVLVDHEIDRCTLTTQRLLQMSKPPALALLPVRVETAVDDVLALLAEEARIGGVRIERLLPAGDHPVWGDEAELRQVLINLFHNAFHAMPAGGRLGITGEIDHGHYILHVADSGCGIAPGDLARIFMPFFSKRADGARGTGLGLAICKAVMRRFGGEISVISSAGDQADPVKSAPDSRASPQAAHGSTFTLRLRLAQGDAQTA